MQNATNRAKNEDENERETNPGDLKTKKGWKSNHCLDSRDHETPEKQTAIHTHARIWKQ
jgi:hypothetical protein